MRPACCRLLLPCFAIAAGLLAGPAHAAWPGDPATNLPLCTAANDQRYPAILAHGAGGAIVAWTDERDTTLTRWDVFAQRVDAAGAAQWTANGVALCRAAHDQVNPVVVTDGAGGAIVAWTDRRNGNDDVYAQRVSAAGVPQWAGDGVAVCVAAGDQDLPVLGADGSGGAVVAWQDHRGASVDIYAQRLSAAGVPQWTADGTSLCVAPGDQGALVLVGDGAGGAIAAWQDPRGGPGSDFDIYAQRVGADGTPRWTADGVALCTAPGYQQSPGIAPDGAGGATVAWQDGRGGAGYDIYAQRVSASGAPMWPGDGVALCASVGSQVLPVIAPDGAGGAIAAWQDNRSPASPGVYAQRVSASGLVQWVADGVAVGADAAEPARPAIVSDAAGGALVAWQHAGGGGIDLRLQRLSAAGALPWGGGGVALCTAADNLYGFAVAPDGAGGALLAWDDFRSGADTNIYTQNVNGDGTLGGIVAAVPSASVTGGLRLRGVQPNPSRGDLEVAFSLADHSPAALELHDLAGRRIASQPVGDLGPGPHVVLLQPRAALPSGVYFVSLAQGGRRARSQVVVLR